MIIKSGATENLMDLAKSDEIDLIFTLDKKIYSSQWMCAAERVEDTIFVTSDRVFAQKSNIHLIQHLAKAAFLLTETGAAYRYELEQMLAEKEIEIVPVLEIGNTETIINLLKRGMGISFLPEFTVKEEIEKGVLFEIRTDLPGVKMYHQLLYHKNKWMTPQMKAFLDLVLAQPGFREKRAVQAHKIISGYIFMHGFCEIVVDRHFSVVIYPAGASINIGMRLTSVAQVNSTVAGRFTITVVSGSPWKLHSFLSKSSGP